MDQAAQEVEQLGERVEQILATVRRLADENASLREQLAASRGDNEHLQQRIAEARERVQAALAHLPSPPRQAEESAPPAQPVPEAENVAHDGNE